MFLKFFVILSIFKIIIYKMTDLLKRINYILQFIKKCYFKIITLTLENFY